MSKDRGGRRSSILKPPKVRHPLTELDLKPLDIEDDGVTTDTTRSRRVSFSAKKGVALFTSDHGNTIWHNIYEEANKPDLSDSGGASHFQMSMNSTKGLCELNAINPGHIGFDDNTAMKVEDDSYNESFNINHDRTFATLPDDSDDEEDHCVDIHAMLTGFSKPVEKELSNIVFQTTQITFSDHTDALINYKIPIDSSSDPLYMENPMQDNKSNFPSIPTHFINDALGGKLDVTNIAGHNNSVNQKDTIFNGSQMDMSITQGIHLPIQEIKNVTLKNNDYDKENIKVHIECHQDINIQEDVFINYSNEKPHVKISTSILDQFQRDFVLKEEHLHEDCSTKMKRSLPEGSNLDDSYILPDKKTKNSSEQQGSDQRCTIIFNQDSSNCDMSITQVNENLIQCKREIDSFYPKVNDMDTDNENVKLQNSIHFYPKNSDCDVSFKMLHKNSQDGQSTDKRRTIIFSQDSSNCDMSMTQVNENLLQCKQEFDTQKENISSVFDHNSPKYNISMSRTGLDKISEDLNEKHFLHNNISNMPKNSESNIDNNRILVKTEDFNTFGENFTKTIDVRVSNPKYKTTKDFDDIKMESNISIIDDFDLQKQQFKDELNNVLGTHNRLHCKLTGSGSKENDQSIKIPGNLETFTNDCRMKGEEMASDSQFLNMKVSCNKGKMINSNEITIPMIDKKRTINFDHLSSEFDMSITDIIPTDRDNERQTKDSDKGKWESNAKHLQKKNDNIRKTVLNSGMSQCETKTANVQQMQSGALNQIKSIGFNPILPECNVLKTSPISKKFQTENKTLSSNSGIPEGRASMPSVKTKNEENKRKTIVQPLMPECNMSMTSIKTNNMIDFDPNVPDISTINDKSNGNNSKRISKLVDSKMSESNMTNVISSNPENKIKIGNFNPDVPECNMSMTSVIPSDQENKRKTLIFDPGMPECNMSMTSVIPNNNENKRQTLIFDSEMPECNMSMTDVILSDQENKRKTLIFDPGMQECNMSITSVISSDQENKRKTLIFNPEMPECNMSMTSVIPSDQENKRKTLIFDHGMPECNMSMTSVISSDQENKRKTLIFNPEMPECNMSMTDVILSDQENKRKTLIFDPGMPEYNMSMTSVISSDQENKRKTLIFDHGMSECNMSMTSVIPSDQENKRKTLIFNPEMPECNMSMTDVILSDQENKRKTLIFDPGMPEYNMSMTSVIPSDQENKRKTLIFNPEMPEYNMSMTSVIPSDQENKRKTLIFDPGMPECNMSMTSVIPSDQENKRKTLIFDHGMPECNMSMTSVIPNDQENKRKTLIFDHGMPECSMSMTSVIPSDQENKRKTLILNPEMQECNMSITSVIPSDQENKRKTLIFDPGMPECNMSMTSVIPSDQENKRKTLIFDHGMPECNMSTTSVIPSDQENKRKTLIFDPGMPECNMSMTSVIPTDQENKRKTLIFDPGMPECNMSMTSVIPSDQENKRKTLIFDHGMPECSMSMTSVIPSDQENKRKTLILNPEMLECNMSITSVIPSDQENKRKTLIFDPGMPECNMSMTSVIPSDQENKRKTLIFDHGMPECNMSTTSVIPSDQENKRKTLIFDPGMPECNMSMTSVIPTHQENKRKTLIFDPGMPECNMSMTSVIPSDQENKRKTLIFDHGMPECNMSTTSVIPSDQENKRKTLIFDPGMPECNMSMTSVIPTDQENKRKTLIFDPGMPECNMSMTSVIPSDQENKRKTLILNPEMLECNMSITSVIPSDQENKRKTLIFDPGMPECNMSMTSVIPTDQENKRKTLIFDPGMPECNMSMTSVIPSDQENKRKILIFDPRMPECNMSMTSGTPSDQENKRKTLIFDPGMPKCNRSITDIFSKFNESKFVIDNEISKCSMSMACANSCNNDKAIFCDSITSESNTTGVVPDDIENYKGMPISVMLSTSVIPSHQENQRNAIHVDLNMSECIKSVTNVISSCSENDSKPIESMVSKYNMPKTTVTNINENKRNIIVFDPITHHHSSLTNKCYASQKNEIFHNYENVKQLTVFDSEVIDKKDNKMKTIVSDNNMPEYNMTISKIQNEDCNQIKKSMCSIKNHNSIVERNEDMLMRNYICEDNVVHTEIPNTSMLEKEVSSHEIYQIMKNPSSLEVIEKDIVNRDVSMLCKSRNENNSNDNVTLEYPLGFSTNLKPGSVNRIQTKSKVSMNLYKENINSSHADSQNISVQGKPATSTLPENKLMTIDGSKNDDNKNKTTAYVKSVDCSMSMTNVLPRSAYWKSKNNITSTSFAAYNPINETRSMLVEHLGNNEKIMLNSSESYGTYREVSRFKDISFTDSPDLKSMDDLSLPSIDDYKIVSCGSGLEVEKYNREVNIIINAPFDDSHMSVDDVHITLPSVEKSIKVNKYSLFEATNLGGTEEKTTQLSSEPCDKNSIEEDVSISTKLVHSSNNCCPLNIQVHAESDYYELDNLSTSKKNHNLHSGDLIQTLNQDLHSEAEILNKSDPISKSSNASREQSDSSTQKVDDSDSSKMKMVHVPVDLLETVGKRKSDHEYNENFNSTISKKQKVLPPVCTWLKDLDGDKESKSNVTNEVVKCSGIHEIDTRTYTITNIDHKKDRSLPTINVKEETNCVLHNRKENNEEVNKNVQNSSDQLIANISDISLVNSSFDKSDLYLREHAVPVSAVDHNIEEKRKLCELIESVDEIIEKQCGTSNFGSGAMSNPRPRNSEKHENYRLTNVSLCESIDTSVELTESPVRLPERRLTAQPEIIVTPVKYIVEELIRNFDFKTKLCALEYIECNECVFLLMDGAIKMTVLLEPSPSGASNLMHPIADIKLALTNESEKFSKPHQMFHWLAIKMVLHELEVRMLRVMCLVSADLPKLLTHCSQVISQAWSWSRQYYALYIKYNLQFENDRWTFEICSGNFLCIWEVEIQVRGGLLSYTVPDNVTVSTVLGDPPIKDCEFKSAMQKVKPSWNYVPKLVEEIHSLVNSQCKSSSR